MFDTERFVQEIKQRECIWNKNHPDYASVLQRRSKWEEVGEIVYSDWNNSSPHKKDEKVLLMTKKWRNIRDYYIKEKKKLDRELKYPTGKRRYCGYFHTLSFLDHRKSRPKRKSSGKDDEETSNHSDNESESSNNDGQAQEVQEEVQEDVEEEVIINIKEEIPTLKRPLKTVTHKVAPSPKRSMSNQGRTQENEPNTNGIKDFLMSLIPDVEMLDDQQYMNFRIGVLNLLNNIKFANNDPNESWVISTLSDNGV